MMNAEEPSSEDTACISIEEYERMISVMKINQIVSTMSLQQLKQAVKFIEILALNHD